MSFLGITFTYIDEDFVIQRGVFWRWSNSRVNTAESISPNCFMQLYGILKDMVGGVTQDNAFNCTAGADALVREGYNQEIFYGCFLHVLNSACQAAIEVYDPKRIAKTRRILIMRVNIMKS